MYYQRLVAKETAEANRDAKKKEIMELAREHYGYEVDLRDNRFYSINRCFDRNTFCFWSFLFVKKSARAR